MSESTFENTHSEAIKEIWALFKETDRKFQETDRKFQDTDRKFQDTDRKFQETDRKFQDTDRKFQDTDRKFDRLSREISELTGSWGKFVESMVEPGVVRLLQERGIEVTGTATRLRERRNGKEMEVDILAHNTNVVVVVEVKTTLKVDDVRDHIDKLKEFRKFYPHYNVPKILGAVAGMKIEEDADRFAYRQGLFVIAQSGETVVLINDDKFIPREW